MKNVIILYRPDELAEHIEVRLEDLNVWLSQQQMATLFNQTKQNISLHINNCLKEDELKKMATVSGILDSSKRGKQNRKTKNRILQSRCYYLGGGYRVKSKQGTQFRIWAKSGLHFQNLRKPRYKIL